VRDLQRVKAINPNASTVIYFNMVLDFPQYKVRKMPSRPRSWANFSLF
jgi:hypothetical protein